MSLNVRIKQARIKNGYTKEEMANKIGVAYSTYAAYEAGSREPDVSKIAKIMAETGVDANFLYVDYLNPNGNEEIIMPYEKKLIKKYRTLDDKSKEIINYIAFGSSAEGSIFK